MYLNNNFVNNIREKINYFVYYGIAIYVYVVIKYLVSHLVYN